MIATRSGASSWEWTRAVGLAVALVALLTYPTVPGLGTMGRLETSDGRFSIWNVGWIDHALVTDPAHLLDANIFYPHTGTLAYSELNLAAGVFGLPAFLVTHNAIAAVNFAVLLGLALSFVCTWALVRRLTGSAPAGEIAAAAFTFCPFVQCHTAHIQLLMIFCLPLTFLAFDRLREQPTIARGVALGLAVAVMGLSCAYYGVYGGAALAAAALLFARRDRAYWLGLAVALAVTAVVTAPVLVVYARARAASGAVESMSRPNGNAYAATVGDYVTSPAHLHRWLNQGAAECAFPGIITLGLAGVGWWSSRRPGADVRARGAVWRYLVVAALAVWASFGPSAGLYKLLYVLPGASLLRAPVRLGIVTVLCLVVAGGFGAAWLIRGRRWLGPVLLVAVVAELSAIPWPLVPRDPVPQAYTLLATLPRGPVVEFLFNYKSSDFHNQTHAMFNSTVHWQPLVNGYSDLIPPDFEAMAVPINNFPDGASFALLEKLHVKYVVFHLDEYQGEARERLLARFPPYASNLRRLSTDQDVWLYEIVSWPPGGSRP